MNGVVGLPRALGATCLYTRQSNNAEPLTNPGNRKAQATRNRERPLLKHKKSTQVTHNRQSKILAPKERAVQQAPWHPGLLPHKVLSIPFSSSLIPVCLSSLFISHSWQLLLPNLDHQRPPSPITLSK